MAQTVQKQIIMKQVGVNRPLLIRNLPYCLGVFQIFFSPEFDTVSAFRVECSVVGFYVLP